MTKIYYFLGHEQFQPETLVEHAVLAEKAGFDGVMVSEHFNPWVDDVGAAGFAFSTLAAIAVKTEKLEMITGVTTPLFRYHPAIVAQAAATIDRLSNGRFTLGVGNGELLNEGPLGYEMPAYAERAARMREATAIMHGLLRGEKVSFDGEYYKTDSAKLYSPPIGKCPIYIAAGGPKQAALTGEIADGLITSVKDPADTIERVINPAKEKNQDMPVLASRWSVYAENKDDMWEALGAWRGLRAPSRDTTLDPEELRKEADSLDREEILSRYSNVHSAADYINEYSPLITELGADTIAIQTTSLDQITTIELLGNEVLPELRKL